MCVCVHMSVMYEKCHFKHKMCVQLREYDVQCHEHKMYNEQKLPF